jgi:His/Glu/Gln/Arg/opine family amino acid ABC transporter permease subunit
MITIPLAMTYHADFSETIKWFPLIGKGLITTFEICAIAMILTMIIALPLALLRMSRNQPLNMTANGVISLTRAVPLYIFMLWLYYGLPLFAGIDMSAWAAGIVTLVVQFSSFQAEAFRSGLMVVGKGQKDAAAAVGLTSMQTFFHITLPQALTVAIPPTLNNLVSIFKATSILAVIGVVEATRITAALAGETGRPLEFYTLLTLIYVIVVGLMTVVMTIYERSTNVQRRAMAAAARAAKTQVRLAETVPASYGR